ncbi:MAG: N-acetylmuramoyl-L-alanine amidase, partial [Sphingomonadaceae bacterium]|nr:N-acetylmuramoyl-L-alanine amidase [Sphingomonadaceae bacterium]
MSLAVAALATFFGIGPLAAATIERVEVEAGRIVLGFDDVVEGASAFVLDGPQRLAI